MKTTSSVSTILKFICLFILFAVIACDKDAINTLNADKAADSNTESRNRDIAARIAATVTLTNPGFESDKTGWGTSFAISTSDKRSGLKSGKLSASSDKMEQTVAVTANTSYTLKAWLLARGTLGVRSGSTTLGSVSANTTAWTQQTVTFNSGSATSVVIYGTYNAGEGRFDDFTLESGSVAPPAIPAAPTELGIVSNGSGSFRLEWRDMSNNETSYSIERKTGSTGTYAQIGTRAAVSGSNVVTNFTNTGLAANTTYFYRVRAVNAAGNSAYSNEATLNTTTPAGLIGLTAATWKINCHVGDPSRAVLPPNDASIRTYKDNIITATGIPYANYADSRYFYTSNGFAYFKAYPGTDVSGSSGNPRVELREMNGATTEASWSGASGTHTMTWTARVDRLPTSTGTKATVCVGQIHAADPIDDVIRVQFTGEKNQTSGNVNIKLGGYVTETLSYTIPGTTNTGNGQYTVPDVLSMNTAYTFKLVYSGSVVKFYINNVLKFTSRTVSSAGNNYFKAGNYLQSVQGLAYDGGFGLVGISSLSFTHQ